MEASGENLRISKKIISILAESNCTVKQAEEILAYVGHTIRSTATVQQEVT